MAIKESNPKLTDLLLRTSQTRTYTVLGATIILTVIMVFFVIRPSLSRILTQNSENKERMAILGELNDKYSSLQALIEQKEQHRDEIDFMNEEILPETRREDEFIANIAKGAERSGVILLSIGVLESTIEDQNFAVLPANVKTYALTASVQGSRDQIEDFVVFLEEFPRVINIRDVVVFRISAEEARLNRGLNPFKADIRAAVYSWEDIVPAPTPVIVETP